MRLLDSGDLPGGGLNDHPGRQLPGDAPGPSLQNEPAAGPSRAKICWFRVGDHCLRIDSRGTSVAKNTTKATFNCDTILR